MSGPLMNATVVRDLVLLSGNTDWVQSTGTVAPRYTTALRSKYLCQLPGQHGAWSNFFDGLLVITAS